MTARNKILGVMVYMMGAVDKIAQSDDMASDMS